MMDRKSILWPKKYVLKVPNKKQELYNDFIEALKDKNLGFNSCTIEAGEKFVMIITDCLWYIDPF